MTKRTDSPKKNVTIKLDPATIDKIEAMAKATGLKKNTIIEQGIARRLVEYEKSGR